MQRALCHDTIILGNFGAHLTLCHIAEPDCRQITRKQQLRSMFYGMTLEKKFLNIKLK